MSEQTTFILIRGATTIVVDPANSVLKDCDILIKDDRIATIGEHIAEPDGNVTVIDAHNFIAIPGFVDGHHHMWQQLLRAVATDWTLFDYTVQMRSIYGSIYSPDDVYLATYAAALSLLNNGVTSVLEHCHIINSPAHADAAIRALKDAGIRATFCYGFYPNPPIPELGVDGIHTEGFSHDARLEDAARVRRQYFGSNDPAEELATFGIAPDEPEAQSIEKTKSELRESREVGARLITMHVAMGPYDAAHQQVVRQLSDANLLGSDLVFSHGASFTDSELEAIKSSGAGIVSTPDTELGMGMGFPVAFRAQDAGCHSCLGIDITSNQGNDFIAQMKLALQAQRALQNEQGALPLTITRKTKDVLRMGTLGGAEVLQIDHLVGSLTVGKKADIVLISRDDLESLPVSDPVGSVVFHTSLSHIDTVIVDGRIRKRNGRLLADTAELMSQVTRRSAEIEALAATFDLKAARAKWLKIFRGDF
ncbi:Metallo-dependent hydrolase [Aaosphaeria arxii CBS 175.79]|uniref:Metallo-dependent hydrolase n=1 Tax=Aaosphaeria arxii CBS 175.79 TaxID=1450172 RepID=A0A6A5XAS5_9PLEO|nr:Metallo-dependent hydrolase [Aaosphaeria arxii CBS 175.79]KAF2010175.1 Metallo-dependent hydrolase [Aaosphaeria arxii CBS 175.79]